MPAPVTLVVHRQLENLTTGNNAYLMTFLKLLARAGLGVDLLFAPRRSFGNRPWARLHPSFEPYLQRIVWPGAFRVGRLYWSLSPRVWGRFVRRLVQEGLNRLGAGLPVYSYFGDPLGPAEAGEVAAELRRLAAPMVIAEYSPLGPVLDGLGPDVFRCVFMHDLMHWRVEEFRRNGVPLDFRCVTEDEERGWVSSADLIVYASVDEMASFGAGLSGTEGVWMCPDTPDYGVIPEQGPAGLVFFGTRHAGNIDSLLHFLADIWPRVSGLFPELELTIAGSVCADVPAAYRDNPRIRLLGRVSDLKSLGGASSIGIAPTRLATGVSIKVIEYLMLGMSCVAYDKAMQGFGDRLDTVVRRCASPEAFGEAITALVSDPALRRSQARSGPPLVARLSRNEMVTERLKRIPLA